MRFPPQSFSAPPFRHRPRPSIIASPMFIRRFITWSPLILVAAVQRMAAQVVVTPGPHHPTAGDDAAGERSSSPVLRFCWIASRNGPTARRCFAQFRRIAPRGCREQIKLGAWARPFADQQSMETLRRSKAYYGSFLWLWEDNVVIINSRTGNPQPVCHVINRRLTDPFIPVWPSWPWVFFWPLVACAVHYYSNSKDCAKPARG